MVLWNRGEQHGEVAKELAEPYYLYGKALLEVARCSVLLLLPEDLEYDSYCSLSAGEKVWCWAVASQASHSTLLYSLFYHVRLCALDMQYLRSSPLVTKMRTKVSTWHVLVAHGSLGRVLSHN